MFIKLGIIACIIVLAVLVLSNETDLFPSTSAAVIDSLRDDVSGMGEKASDSIDRTFDELVGKITDNTNSTITDDIGKAGERLSSEISRAGESQEKMTEKVSNFDPIESIRSMFA